MSFKDTAEDFLDRTIGKPARKALEQVGHGLMAAAVGSVLAAAWWGIQSATGISIPVVYLVLVVVGGLAAGLVREYFQNRGDGRDHTTLFMIGDVPINSNMLIDILAYFIGSAVGGLIWMVFNPGG